MYVEKVVKLGLDGRVFCMLVERTRLPGFGSRIRAEGAREGLKKVT